MKRREMVRKKRRDIQSRKRKCRRRRVRERGKVKRTPEISGQRFVRERGKAIDTLNQWAAIGQGSGAVGQGKR